jgi:hypothetical protein
MIFETFLNSCFDSRAMDVIEIPVATVALKAFISGLCGIIALAILFWWAPKFALFLKTVLGTAPRKPESKTIHQVLGFVVYLLICAPAFIAGYVGVTVATAKPTRLSAEGIEGVDWACQRELGVLFACSSPLGERVNSRRTIRWGEIDKVQCFSDSTGVIREISIHAAAQHIQIGSLAVRDLREVRRVILSQVAQSAAQPCTGW